MKKFNLIYRHVEIAGQSDNHIFTIRTDNSVAFGEIGFSAVQRKWAMISVDSKIIVKPFQFDLRTSSINILTIEVDFIQKKNANLDPYDSDRLANDLLQQFSNQAFTVGQQVSLFKYQKILLNIIFSFFSLLFNHKKLIKKCFWQL